MQNIIAGLLLLLVTILTGSSSSPTPPICQSGCQCVENPLIIECQKISEDDLFSNATWYSPTGEPYPIQTFVAHAVNLLILHTDFPTSPLRHLDLSHSNITVTSDAIFKNLQNMTILNLSHNNLKSLDPETFKGKYHESRYMPLFSLRVLRLDHNELLSIHPDLFKHIEDLETLDLSYNPLKIINKDASVAISSLQKLKNLDLSSTQIHNLPEYFLYTQKSLEILDLSYNPIKTLPSSLKYSINLNSLYLNGTLITYLNESNCFPELPNLRSLHMCHLDTLKNISKHALSNLNNLEELYLCYNPRLEYIDPNAFGKLTGGNAVIYPPLRKLYIQSNRLEFVSSEMIAAWDRLVELDIRDNPWACECTTAWLVTVLMPIYARITDGEDIPREVTCGSPMEMEHYSMYDLYKKNYHVRCLDLYGSHPENDALMLVGVLAGILISLPIILFILYAYQRHWFGLFSSSPAAYSRQFYNSNGRVEEDDNDF